MDNQQAPTPTITRMAPKMWNKQGLTLDDQKHGAEDGDQQVPTSDDQMHGGEDG